MPKYAAVESCNKMRQRLWRLLLACLGAAPRLAQGAATVVRIDISGSETRETLLDEPDGVRLYHRRGKPRNTQPARHHMTAHRASAGLTHRTAEAGLVQHHGLAQLCRRRALLRPDM